MLPPALEIIFEMERKRNNDKRVRKKKKKKTFQLAKHVFFFFHLLFGPFLLSKLQTFSFLVHFKQFKVLLEWHFQFYKSFWNSNNNKATYKEFFGCLGTSFVTFIDLFLWVLNPSNFGGHKFSILIRFEWFLVRQIHQ
jgi:hypothetical protein